MPASSLASRQLSHNKLICQPCSTWVSPALCYAGRTTVYAQTAGECSTFGTEEAAFASLAESWAYDAAANETLKGCADALAVFFCAQEDLLAADGSVAECSSYRRPLRANVGQCNAFCRPIGEACPGGNAGAGTLSMSTGSSAAITKLPDGVRGFKVNALVGKGEVERRGRQEAPRGVFKLSPPQLK